MRLTVKINDGMGPDEFVAAADTFLSALVKAEEQIDAALAAILAGEPVPPVDHLPPPPDSRPTLVVTVG
jgi:hypothetical protein